MSISRTSLDPRTIDGIGRDRGRDAEPPRHVGDGRETDLSADLGADRVDRAREGFAQRHRAEVGAGRVARAPAIDRHRLVDDRVGRLHPGFERGEIDEQLERRARLAFRLGRAVVDRCDIILAADHRADRAVAVDRDQRALRSVGRVGADRRSAATCMPGSSVVQTSIGSLVSSISVSSCGSAQSVK